MFIFLHMYAMFIDQCGCLVVEHSITPLMRGSMFDSLVGQTKDFKSVVEDPLSNAQHIKGSLTQ